MKELHISSAEKECTGCHKTFPATLEYFSKSYHSQRDKTYLNSKCRSCLRDYNRKYRKENREKVRERQRAWTQTPRGAYKSLKNSTRGHLVKITQKKFAEWYNSQPRKCYYCGLTEEMLQSVSDRFNNKTFRLSVDRIDSSKDYEEGNLVLCCLRCNHIKGDFFTQSEMGEIGEKYIAPKWRKDAKTH